MNLFCHWKALKFFIPLASLAFYVPLTKAASLCEAREKVIFSCELKNAKTVSICAFDDENRRYVEYKFGRQSKIELAHRASNENENQFFHRADIIYGNNAVDTIWFRNGEHLYDVFMPARGAPAVEVWKKNRQLAHIECSGGWTNVEGDTDMASPFIINHGDVDVSKRNSLWFGR
jgi:hypothetical protein